jgi:hypothetical protein
MPLPDGSSPGEGKGREWGALFHVSSTPFQRPACDTQSSAVDPALQRPFSRRSQEARKAAQVSAAEKGLDWDALKPEQKKVAASALRIWLHPQLSRDDLFIGLENLQR